MHRIAFRCRALSRENEPRVRPTVTAVIPTIGRPTLEGAVDSVLAQTFPVSEVIVVADREGTLPLPHDDRIVVLRSRGGQGPARCRQQGIDAARGSVIALLDDDDTWYPEKLARQLSAVPQNVDEWVGSSRVSVLGPGDKQRVWPRQLIGPRDSVAEYLFRLRDPHVGGALLQSSTLCFPTELARQVRWDSDPDSVHDEAGWLLAVARSVPDVVWCQVPDVLSTYDVQGVSLSRSRQDRTAEYVGWGLGHLTGESPRVRGDYLCTSPVSAAVSAQSPAGVLRALTAGVRHGRPGIAALLYAVMNLGRAAARRATAAVGR
ncbi:glycosyltransferase family 2 protein [Gordonia sp. CPCC 205515]|uniref:glycosyltransferase family 2 protein n=1 Tax=Gordonia sp. CPCC 205515 TaxID=3140791 RepID=UPI003AF39901